jgi:3,4-dihydroxy 2-butanone 4-phosphate synthase/GTP cyclohydrolase II
MQVQDSQFCDVSTALEEMRSGRVRMLADREGADTVCHLAVAADRVTLEALRSIMSLSGGLPCVATPQSHLDRLQLPSFLQCDFALRAAFNGDDDPRRPIIPLTTSRHGVLARPGAAECVVDLARLAGMSPAGFFCTVMRAETAKALTLTEWDERHSLKMFNIAELVKHRLANEIHIRIKDVFPMQTRFGHFQFSSFESDVFDSCTALTKADPQEFQSRPPLVRIEAVHSPESACTTLLTCLNHEFQQTLDLIYHDGAGIIIGVPCQRQLSAEELVRTTVMPFFQEDPFSTLEGSVSQQLMAAGICSQILHYFSADHIRIVTNKPRRLSSLTAFSINIVSNVSPNLESTTEETTAARF